MGDKMDKTLGQVLEEGMQVRRAVLGEAHVERSMANVDEFNEEFQNLISRYAWGETWTRPGLDHKTRSCMVLSTMIALRNWDEFKLHIRGAFNNGLTKDDIKEVLLQAAVYAGVPSANKAFHVARETFKELGV